MCQVAEASPAEPQVPLSKERVLRAAAELADREGLESLTMRKLAEQLGAGAMSLYHHVPNKDALLDGMVDIVFGEIEVPTTDGDWKTALRKRAISTRDALRRHRWAIGLMESRTQPGPANLRLHNAVLACLREAGFSIADAVHAYSVQDAYIYGFALQEKSLPFETSEEAAQIGEMMVRQFQHLADQLPYSFEVVGGYVAKGGYDPTAEFEFGLNLILDGLERLRDTRPDHERRRRTGNAAGLT
jgi:AcrR family transcriptional regulator